MAQNKRQKAILAAVTPGKAYAIDEALKIVKTAVKAKFVESVDVAVRLGVDAKKSDQQVRGSTVLPAGTGKSVRVAVFAPAGAKADEAAAAGAEAVGMDDLAEKMLAGDINYDVVIATPDAMRGRVSSINGIFIGSSNELGAFYDGVMARLVGPDGRVVAVKVQYPGADHALKADLKTLKEDLKAGAREETQRLREKASEAENRLRAKSDEVREQARGYYEQARVRGREYYDDAAERLDEAQRYVVERVQERPLQSTAIALGVGLVLGMLLAGRRR